MGCEISSGFGEVRGKDFDFGALETVTQASIGQRPGAAVEEAPMNLFT
jgi:hypothetical protein